MKREKFDFGGWATRNDLLCADGRTIRKNAFKDDDGRTVPLVYQHNHDDPTRIIGHALLENREDGVYAYCSLNSTDIGRHVKECVRHGDINGLSIYANKLKQHGGDVIHGVIRELSVVLAGANPGAVIEFPILEHGEESETEAYIWPGEEDLDMGDGMKLSHSADEDDEEPETKSAEKELSHAEEAKEEPKEDGGDETVQDILDSLNQKQKAAVDNLIDQTLSGEEPDSADVLKMLNEKQQKVVTFLVEQAKEVANSIEEEDEEDEDEEENEASHSDDEGEEIVMANVFDRTEINEQENDTLTHAQMDTILKDGKRLGSLRQSVLEHSAEYGIEQIDYLMPEYREVTGNGAPSFIKRDQKWVTKVMNGVHHTPFSKIKTTFADITNDEARARGYVKGNLKIEEVFALLKRTTDATTVYKKQKLDRDDVIEVTDFDVVAWLKSEMRMMLDEELARAFLIGDGRAIDSDDKINESNIRPVFKDAPLYVIRRQINLEGGQDPAEALIDAVTYAWEDYQGSGNCVAFMTRRKFSQLKLLKDRMGRRIYETDAAVASALGVSEVIFVPQMADTSTVRTVDGTDYAPAVIILDLNDYNVGADKGGSVNMFDDFDIDYNQMKYLIETRCSGALVKPYSAIIIEEEVNPS